MRRLLPLAACLLLSLGLAAQNQGPIGTMVGPQSTGGTQPALNLQAQTEFSIDELARLPEGRALLAATTPDYPVTPGDVYTLAFLKSSESASLSLVVQSDYAVNLGVFGQVSARGQSYAAFKASVEQRVAAAYPGSSPELLIRATGTFTVKVEGEVQESGLAQSWGLERLSRVYGRVKSAFASERKVLVRSVEGEERYYDLFLAHRRGDLSQDPYLRPGDVLVLTRIQKRVGLAGAVYRPGSYEPLAEEGLPELVKDYGEGLLPGGRGEYAQLSRKPSSANAEGEILYFDASAWTGLVPELLDGDEVLVPRREDYLPVVYFEGAISSGTEAASQYGMDRYAFKPGDRLSRALRSVAGRLSPNADLRRAFVARKGQAETISVDLEKLLYAYDPALDLLLEAEDRVVIPKGSLDVFITGEVTKSSWVNTAALTRLSAAIAPLLTRYSSIRDVLVRNAEGEERRYDLFRAERYGALSEDPFLKPGDTVSVERAARIVSIAGEVKRPGNYQLLQGEKLRELVEVYAEGFTEKANAERLSLTRAPAPSRPLGYTSYLSYSVSLGQELDSFDSILVPGLSELLPVVYFEGAIGVGVNGESPQAANHLPFTFVPGMRLSQAAQALRKQFSAVSDIQRAYVLRGSERIFVNLAAFIYDKDFRDDMPLEQGDIIIVPFRQFFVSVSGAVINPGRYPYVPDRGWEYYVGLAGGFDKDRNAGERLDIITSEGKKRPRTGHLQPEDTIVAADNSFLYGFGKVASILTTIISVASLVISIARW